ncbi:hypothetical protein FDECE_12037 [Fusarium decemcellulare]|nr:hypothetical protein FDECE_12037 [Fusarium decemcellulare]
MPPTGTEARPDNNTSFELRTANQVNAPERQVKGTGRSAQIQRTGDVDEQTTPSVEPREGLTRTSEAGGSSQSPSELGINFAPHPLLKYVPKADRDTQSKETDKLFRVAKHLKLDFTDIHLDHVSFLPTWDTRDEDLKRLHAEGKLKRLVAEPPPQPPSKRARTEKATESGFTVGPAILDPIIKGALIRTIKDVPNHPREWDILTSDSICRLGFKFDLTLGVAREALQYVEELMAKLENALGPKNTGGDQWTLDEIIRLMLRVLGLVNRWSMDWLNYATRWGRYKEILKNSGKKVETAMNVIFALRDVEGGLEISAPQLKILKESALIKDQMKLCKRIKQLLDDWEASH